jgi:L-threonylcarbamoyladenylate synthase
MRLNAVSIEPGEGLLAFGGMRAEGWRAAAAFRNLSEVGDLREAASNLFAFMEDLDRSGVRSIAAEPIPFDGLGEAINDRLSRAAAPRDAGQPAPGLSQ